MDTSDHLHELRESGELLARAAAAAGPHAAVPTCPGWRVRDLLHHVSGIHRWAANFVRTGKAREGTDEEDAEFFPTVPDRDLPGWYHEGHISLVAALSEADPATTCWTFLPGAAPVAFWARRQAHETAIHSVDAQAAAGWSPTFRAEFATDGIDELLAGFLARPIGRLVADPAVTLAVLPTDVGRGWTIRIEPDRRVVSAGVSAADCVVTGPACELYLLLWNRRQPGPDVDVHGDGNVLDQWREHATINWA